MDTRVLTERPQVSLQNVSTSPYVPDGVVDGNGLVMLTAAGAAVGVVTGIAFGLLSQWLYAVILFPIVIGLIVGSAQKFVITRVKIRNTFASGLAGLIAGLSVVVTMHYVDYVYFQREQVEFEANWQSFLAGARQEGYTAAEIAEIRQRRENDPEEIAIAGVQSFLTYIDWSATQGVELSSTRASGAASSPINLGYWGTYVYWSVDALIIAAMTIFLTREQASQPFCTECNRWKEEVELGRLTANAKHVALAVGSGQLSGLPDLSYGTSHLAGLSVHLCGVCQNSDDIVVQVKNITYNNGQEVKADFGRYQCDESAVEELTKLFDAANEAAAQPLDEESEQLLAAANEVYANA